MRVGGRRTWTLSLAAVLLAGSFAWAQDGTAESPYEFVAYLPDPTADAEYLEMVDSFEAYAEYMREMGVGEFRPYFFTSLQEAESFILERRAQGRPPVLGVIHNLLVVEKAEKWGFKPIACPVYEGSTKTRQVVIAPRSHPASSVRDLEGQRLAVVRVWGDIPAHLGLVLFNEAISPRQFFRELVTTERLNDCLTAVMRRAADAAMVNQAFFDVAQRRSRHVWKEFKVLGELPEQHIAPVVAFDGAPPELIEKIKAVIFGNPDSDAGRHLLEVFNLDGFEPCDVDEFVELEGQMLAKLGKTAPKEAAGTAAPTATVEPDATPEPAAGSAEAATGSADEPEVELERDEGAGYMVTLRFSEPPSVEVGLELAFDGGEPVQLPAQCIDTLCVVAVPGDLCAGKERLSLRVRTETPDGPSLGRNRDYPLGR